MLGPPNAAGLPPHAPSGWCVSVCLHGGTGGWEGSRLLQCRGFSLLHFHLLPHLYFEKWG